MCSSASSLLGKLQLGQDLIQNGGILEKGMPLRCQVLQFVGVFPAVSMLPKRSRAGGSRQRGAASFAAEALPVLPISGMRSQHCPPQREAANKLIRIMGN